MVVKIIVNFAMMRLKRHTILLMTAIYLVSFAGLAFNLHFCSGKLSTVAINAPVKVCKMCAKLAKENIEDGCCKTETVELKVEDDHHAGLQLSLLKAIPEFLLPKWVAIIPTIDLTEPTLLSYAIDVPPDISGIPLHVFNCTYRI